ncbi:hypothetical protein EFD55_05175 [Rhizobium pisi]|uniref:Uncharacterized protein n=1 Tax=Rhizobium pisi TaxID=574561 RepID=A0A3R9HKV8_9HYPH|nr:hypothetical protein EFD55_05175 [Rhizobium pisi]TCA57624.1 hypothetical protein E0J16_12400 [Rhizobium pisi]
MIDFHPRIDQNSGGRQPLIRLPAPSPRKRGEGECRNLSVPRHVSHGKSPLPACGERVRVRGKQPANAY